MQILLKGSYRTPELQEGNENTPWCNFKREEKWGNKKSKEERRGRELWEEVKEESEGGRGWRTTGRRRWRRRRRAEKSSANTANGIGSSLNIKRIFSTGKAFWMTRGGEMSVRLGFDFSSISKVNLKCPRVSSLGCLYYSPYAPCLQGSLLYQERLIYLYLVHLFCVCCPICSGSSLDWIVGLPVCLPVCLCVCMSVCMSVHLCMFTVCPSHCLSVCLHVRLCVCSSGF